MKLSILIPTLFERETKFKKIYQELCLQAIGKEVEVLYEVDNKEETTGAKRNKLLERAKGDYVVFVDDDDKVSTELVYYLLEGIKSNHDVITYDVLYKNRQFERPVHYSIQYKRDQNLKDRFLRIPNHLMCVKRNLALKAKFPDKTFGEDAEYAKRLLPLIVSEYRINKQLYTYVDIK